MSSPLVETIGRVLACALAGVTGAVRLWRRLVVWLVTGSPRAVEAFLRPVALWLGLLSCALGLLAALWALLLSLPDEGGRASRRSMEGAR
jgi:hypothetical protein